LGVDAFIWRNSNATTWHTVVVGGSDEVVVEAATLFVELVVVVVVDVDVGVVVTVLLVLGACASAVGKLNRIVASKSVVINIMLCVICCCLLSQKNFKLKCAIWNFLLSSHNHSNNKKSHT
jgi:hypothetical protein